MAFGLPEIRMRKPRRVGMAQVWQISAEALEVASPSRPGCIFTITANKVAITAHPVTGQTPCRLACLRVETAVASAERASHSGFRV